MLKEFLTNNWFFVGIGFVLIFGFGCYLWFQNDLANFRQQHAPISQLDNSTEIEQSGTLQAELTAKQTYAQSGKKGSDSTQIADATQIVRSSEENYSENGNDAALEGTLDDTAKKK